MNDTELRTRRKILERLCRDERIQTITPSRTIAGLQQKGLNDVNFFDSSRTMAADLTEARPPFARR